MFRSTPSCNLQCERGEIGRNGGDPGGSKAHRPPRLELDREPAVRKSPTFVDETEDILAQADGPRLVDIARASGSTAGSREVLARATRLVAGEPLRAARYALAAAFVAPDNGPPAAAARQLEARLRAACGDLGEALFEVDAMVDPALREEPLATVLERLAIGDPPEATRQLAKLKSAAHRDRVLAVLVEATRGVFLAQKIADEALRAGSLANIGEWEEAELVVADIATARGRAGAHQQIAAAARATGDDARARKHEALADGARGGIADDAELATAMREAASIAGGEIADALLDRATTLDASPAAARDVAIRRARLAIAAGELDRAVHVDTIIAVFPELARARFVLEVAAHAVAGDAIGWAEARSSAVLEAAVDATVAERPAAPRRSSDDLDDSWDGDPGPSTVRHDIDRGKPPWSDDTPAIKPAPIVSVAPPAEAAAATTTPPPVTLPIAPVVPAVVEAAPPPAPMPTLDLYDLSSDDDIDATSIMGAAERRALQLAARTGEAAVVREVAERIASERDLEQRRLAVLTEGYETARRIAVVADIDAGPLDATVARPSEAPGPLPSVIGPPMEDAAPPPPPRPAPAAVARPVAARSKRSPLAVVGIVALVAAAAIIVLFYARMLGGHR